MLRPPADPTRPPDVVLILTDDQRPDTLGRMPTVRRQLRDKGLRFSRTIAPTATCCPSRASLATGLFAHETGVWGNTPPHGGWRSFYDNGNEDRTLARALHTRGYRTGLFGKYANGYGHNELGFPAGHVPPGWDTFLTFATSSGAYIRLHAVPTAAGTGGSRTTTRPTCSVRGQHSSSGAPAPNSRCSSCSRRSHRTSRTVRPAGTSTSWRKAAGVPPAVGDRGRQRQAAVPQQPAAGQADDHQPDPDPAAGELLSVDEAVAGILRALRETGRLHNTLLVYMSDNGLMIGDHHTVGKNMPYRSATDVPLSSAGTVTPRVVPSTTGSRANIDVTTTISNATGAGMTTSGLDLVRPRRAHRARCSRAASGGGWTEFGSRTRRTAGWRSARYLFVHWADGVEELYDHVLDRYETQNRGRGRQVRRRWSRRCGGRPASAACRSRRASPGRRRPHEGGRPVASSIASQTVRTTATRAKRLSSAGTTCQGAGGWSVRASISSTAASYCVALLAVAPVLVGELPGLQRVVLAALEAAQLLLVGDVHPELDQDHALGHQGRARTRRSRRRPAATARRWRSPRPARPGPGRTRTGRTRPCRPSRAASARTATGSGGASRRTSGRRTGRPARGGGREGRPAA